MYFLKRSILLLFLSNVLYSNIPLVTETKITNPNNLLVVGNSFIYFNNGMHNPLESLVNNERDLVENFQIRKITISGASLSWHDVNSYISNPDMGSFAFDVNNNLVKKERLPFDAVIMHDCSRCPIDNKENFHKTIEDKSKKLKKADIEPILMMTWAYKDTPNMIEEISNEYIKAANKNEILVVPVGLAFDEIEKNFSEIELYMKDKRHPTRAGTYLGACVIFSSIYKRSPEKNPYLFDLDPDVAKTLQKVAWNVTEKFFNQKKL